MRPSVVGRSCYICQYDLLDTKHPGVELETGDAEVIRDSKLIEFSPYPGYGFQWEC